MCHSASYLWSVDLRWDWMASCPLETAATGWPQLRCCETHGLRMKSSAVEQLAEAAEQLLM